MAGEVQDAVGPLPKFMFIVDWGDQQKDIQFQEVSGLDAETQIVEYKTGNSPEYNAIKMPGIAKFGNVTMKRGVFIKDNSFWKWYDQIQMNTIKKQTITIKLLNETGTPTMIWNLKNAWPTKISSTDLKSDGNEVAIDSIEVAHEGLTIVNSG
ncbi:MAG: phage tail protein [Roseivirga sp.]